MKPPPVVLPKLPVTLPLPPEVVLLLTEASQQSGACDLTAPVQAALQADPAVANAVILLPRDARSVANAVMVWNEVWFPSDESEATALTAVREAIVTTIDAASPRCRQAQQTGPRFLTLGDTDATVLALGSEEWRWQDLVDTAAAQAATPWERAADRRQGQGSSAIIALQK